MGKFFSTVFVSMALIVVALGGVITLMDSIGAPAEAKEIRANAEIEKAQIETKQELERIERWHNYHMNAAGTAETFMLMLGIFIKAMGYGSSIAVGAFVIWSFRWVGRPLMIRAENGLFPIVERNVLPWWKRLMGKNQVTYGNMNQIVAPFVSVIHEGQEMRTLSDTTGMSPQMLADAHKGGQKVQMVQAGMKRVPAPSKWQTLAENGLLEQFVPQRKESNDKPLLPMVIEPELTLDEAIKQSRVETGLVIGQDAQTHAPCLWHPKQAPHIGIWGSTQQGKTSSGASTVVLDAIAMKWHVLILDPEAEGYWSMFRQHTEVVETEGDLLAEHMDQIGREYMRRGKVMEVEGVNHYNRMKNPPPRVLIVIEEFSDLYGNSKQSEVLRVMETLFRRGGKRGMHFLLIDQHPSRWPDGLRQNTAMRLSFKQPVKDWSLVSHNDLDTLNRGQFAHNGRVYNAFHAEAELMPQLARLPRFGYKHIVCERVNAVETPPLNGVKRGVGRGNHIVNVTPENGRSPSVLPPFLRVLLGNKGTVENAAADSREWDELAALLFARKPQTTQSELCRVMAAADPQGREPGAFKGKLSMDLFHCYSLYGDRDKIQTAKRKEISRTR